ncbi:MAG: D-alanyl-D-alanine carboxypeptidase [Roseburia sp.]|nr:D-alanyl-D-alanine carboxypeptidase [Anaeroplasma bactoclasticum]MCM1196334.1 D-alanyl-D-alanine carboxypeptidase [Roseburia sp.]MCM1557555.1 D-alanyl-D-alanine carboxypeptidase [Anaeroplasma bactoclasticum]
MKKMILVLIGASLFGLFSTKVSAIEEPIIEETTVDTKNPDLCGGSTAAILIETSTGKILYNKEKDRRLSPASMTKIMTLLLIYEALDSNQITKSTMLTIGEEPTKVEGSKAFLSIGDEINVDELLKCICIASANDAAIAMAMHLEGTEAAFVDKMNVKAEELGLKNTHFSDCTGLSSRNHYTSAYDLAVISNELIQKHPDVLNYTNLQEDYIRKDTSKPFWLVNTNKMIGRVKYIDGLKTGYTSFSKYCITLHMKQDNMGLIAVVFGYDKPTTRNAESLELLRWGYANYKLDKVVEKNKVVDSVDHILYKNRINIVVENDVYYLSKKSDKVEYDVKYEYLIQENKCTGKVYVYSKDTLIQEGNLVNQEEIQKKNFFELWSSIFTKTLT